MRTLILGGARSGKSRYAEQCARDSGLEVVYIATAEAGDAEMAKRIAEHRARRPSSWGLIEEPLALARAIEDNAAPSRCLVVDCLTLWLSNLLAQPEDPHLASPLARDPHPSSPLRRGRRGGERAALLDVLPTLPGAIYLISNEVGQGIVPANALARRFVDEAGWLHQDLARICERVVWVAAGLPQILKDKHGTVANP